MSALNLFQNDDNPRSPEVLRGVPRISPEAVEACDARWPMRHLAEDAIEAQFARDYPVEAPRVDWSAPETTRMIPENIFTTGSVMDNETYRTLGQGQVAPTDIAVARGRVEDAYRQASKNPNMPSASGF